MKNKTPPVEDAGLAALVAVARFHGIAADAAQLKHAAANGTMPFTENDLVLTARRIGLKARAVDLKSDRLAGTPLPALVLDRDGRHFILAKSDGKTALVLEAGAAAPNVRTLEEIVSRSDDSYDTGYDDDYDMNDDDSWFDDDPIVLNLTGGAVQTTALANSPATFDLLNNGQPVQTGWGTAGEGYLVYDPNDSENTTTITEGSQLLAGMDALATLAEQVDGISEGELTSSDALWSGLKVWVDTTGTGQFQAGQLYSLSQLGIASLSLEGTAVDQNDNGNQIVFQGAFSYANGTTGQMAGVNLGYNGVGMAGLTADQSAATGSDVSMSALIAAMAAYAAPAPASVTANLAGALRPDVSAMLATSAH